LKVTPSLWVEDAKPIVREAALVASRFGGLLDHHPRRCWDSQTNHGETLDEARKRWAEKYQSAKRVLDAFGAEVEPVPESEAVGVHYPHYKGEKIKVVNLPGLGPIRHRSGGTPIKSKPEKIWRGTAFRAACQKAADDAVEAWAKKLYGVPVTA